MRGIRIPTGDLFLPHVSKDELIQLRDDETDLRYKPHYDAALLRKEGDTMITIARNLGVSSGTIANWLSNMTTRGIGRSYKVRQGRPPKFTQEQLDALEEDMKQGPRAYGMDSDRWISATVADYAMKKFSISITPGSMRRLMLREDVDWPGSAKAMAKERERAAITSEDE